MTSGGAQRVDLACPCDGDWKNHGKYVSCVSQTAEDLLADGLFTADDKDAAVSERARTGCGRHQ